MSDDKVTKGCVAKLPEPKVGFKAPQDNAIRGMTKPGEKVALDEFIVCLCDHCRKTGWHFIGIDKIKIQCGPKAFLNMYEKISKVVCMELNSQMGDFDIIVSRKK